jgi:hypothetical protein
MPVYKVQHLKRCCIAESRYGEADTLFRDFWIDAYQAGQQFGEDTLPDTVRQAKKNGSLKLWKFTQAIIPPEKYEIGVSKRNGFEYYSVMWADVEKDKPLLEGWYVLKPFFVWRWSRNLDGGPWGVDAPGMLEISNIKQLNQMRKDRTRASQLSVQPPYKATEGLEGRINLRPNGFTYVRPGQDFTPVPTSGRIDAFDQDIALLQKSINSAYFTDLFLILSQNLDKQKTATEVSGIQGEKAALMSSFYGRLTAEFLEPCLEDLFALELMAGRIPPPPDSLRQSRHGLRFDMVSPLAQMQERYLTLGSSQQAMAEIAALSQMRPEILDNIDLDQYVRTLVDAYGMDKRIIVNMADVRRMRQARAQAQAQMQQFAMQQEAAKTGAEVMSALPPEAAGGIQQ